jgi:PAS domain S-box-containing protein
MPGFDGMEALRLSRELAPDTPFIFVSGTLGEDYAIRALKSGATDYVLKSNLVRLPAAVERALEGADERRARRSAQVALRRAQGMARLAHVVTGDEGVFDSWSASLPGMLGLQQETMPRSTREWLELLHPEDREAFRQASIEAGATGGRVDVEYRLRHSGGKWLHVRQAVEPLAAALGAGNSRQWFSTLQDITEQKRAEAAVRKAEENYRSVFNNSTVGIFIVEPGGRVNSANPALARILGYASIAEMLSGISDVSREVYVEPDARRRYRELLKAEGAVTNFETRWRRRDGAVIWVSLNGREVRDEAGAVVHQLGMVEDITERKVAEIHVTRLNRVYAVLSRINSLIVRAGTRQELFREACRIAVEDGKFPLAWIGVVGQDGAALEVEAWAGDGEGYLSSMPLAVDENGPGAVGMAGQAIQQLSAMIANDIATDERIRIKEIALARGFAALVVLPLIVAHKPIGVLALYSEQAGFFDEQEMRLLNELAGDISFAVDHIVKSE